MKINVDMQTLLKKDFADFLHPRILTELPCLTCQYRCNPVIMQEESALKWIAEIRKLVKAAADRERRLQHKPLLELFQLRARSLHYHER